MKHIFRYLVILIFLPFHLSYGQSQLDSMMTKFALKSSGYPSEMIYLQTNKDIYETGEDLWFKAYQLNAQTLALSSQSRSLYLQIRNETDSVVWQEKYPVENGIACGHVLLNQNLSAGNYFLESYTANSFCRDSSTFSSIRKIKIQENISDRATVGSVSSNGFRFETYPEGGSLIAGVTSCLAFKATDDSGNPVEVSGTLYEGEEPLTEFKSVHDGMGSFLVTPLSDKNYFIRLSNNQEYPLPEIHSQGISLRFMRQDKDFIEFMVTQSPGLDQQTIYLFGQLRGIPCCGANNCQNCLMN